MFPTTLKQLHKENGLTLSDKNGNNGEVKNSTPENI